MSERIVSPEEAQVALSTPFTAGFPTYAQPGDLLHTVATEPDRTRAAVGRAMQVVAQEMPDSGDCARAFVQAVRILKGEGLIAGAIENGADL